MTNDVNFIHAEPQKHFFIDMLTRDIGLIECILDLIDNSIHSLIDTSQIDVMKFLKSNIKPKLLNNPKIDISFSNSNFSA